MNINIIVSNPQFDYHSEAPFAHTVLRDKGTSVTLLFEDALQRALFFRRLASEASAMLETEEVENA